MTPRLRPVVLLGVAAAVGCGARALRSSDPGQSIADGREAQGDIGGVAVRAQLGGWRGDPKDLEQRLTPVDVTVRNGTKDPIRLGPETFALIADGNRLRVLTQDEVSYAVAQLTGFRRPRPPRSGAVGGPAFPGYDDPNAPDGPFSTAPVNQPVPSAGGWHDTQPLSGTLAPGRSTSVLVYFDTPARTLRSATFEVEVVTSEGAKLGTIRMPYEAE